MGALDMSVRSTPRNNNTASSATTPSQQQPIEFRSEFVNSPAAVQARHEETMGTLLSRLDQLQAKVCSQSVEGGEAGLLRAAPTTTGVQSVFKTRPLSAAVTQSDLHERWVV